MPPQRVLKERLTLTDTRNCAPASLRTICLIRSNNSFFMVAAFAVFLVLLFHSYCCMASCYCEDPDTLLAYPKWAMDFRPRTIPDSRLFLLYRSRKTVDLHGMDIADCFCLGIQIRWLARCYNFSRHILCRHYWNIVFLFVATSSVLRRNRMRGADGCGDGLALSRPAPRFFLRTARYLDH